MSEYYSQTLGPYRVVIQSVRIVGGRVIAECYHPKTNQRWEAPMLSHGGGKEVYEQWPVKVSDTATPERAVVVPEDEHAAEGFLQFDVLGAPILTGVISREQPIDLRSEPPSLEDGDPHPGWYGPHDVVKSNGANGSKTKLILSRDLSMNIVSSGPVRIQVPAGQRVSVFSDGDSGMPVVLFEPNRDAMNRIIERVNANTEQLRRLTPPAAAAEDASATVETGLAAADAAALNLAGAALHTALAQAHAELSSDMTAWLGEVPIDLIDVGNEIASDTLFVPSGYAGASSDEV